MLRLVFQKIFSNSWKVACLLLGSILVVGMICSIPIYSNGILQRMLTRDLENSQLAGGRYPGYLAINNNYSYISYSQAERLIGTTRLEAEDIVRQMPVEPQYTEELMQISNLYYVREEETSIRRRGFNLGSITDFPEHVNIVRGRMYNPDNTDGVLEVIVSDAVMRNVEIVLDREYPIYSYRQPTDDAEPILTVRVVGLYEAADLQSTYWYQSINRLHQTMMTDHDSLQELAAAEPLALITEHLIYAAFDYHQFRIQDVPRLMAAYRQGRLFAEDNVRSTQFTTTYHNIVESYSQRESELKLTLQILIIPILLMLVFYIFMVSQLMVRSETNVISVLESRGAGRRQILGLYGIESLILGAVTFGLGPFLGLWMVRIIGAANGFLEFVNRSALKTELDRQALLYGFLAVMLFLITTLLPVFLQAKTSIVQQKRKKSRVGRPPLWQRLFLDIILSGVSLYALNRLNAQIEIQRQLGGSALEINLDFLLFLASTLFVLGIGLFFLRLYPYLLRLVYWLGQRIWKPALYASFHQISRSGGQEQFLMLFLILALSIGLFNANAARTINRNTEDSIRIQVGTDLMLQENWLPYDQAGNPIVPDGMGMASPQTGSDTVVRYIEPRFSRFSQLEGVEHTARVYRTNNTRISRGGQRSGNINLMAIDPYDFALTAWSRSDLLSYHMYDYMNVMISVPNAVILSSNLRDELDISVGDAIIYTVNGSDNADGVVIAFVDHWPGFQPRTIDSAGRLTENRLIVSNLEFLLANTAMQPYEVWLKREAGVTDSVIYEAIEEQRIRIDRIKSSNQEIAAAKNDPKLQGTNGALTLGFIVSMLVCAVGFLIYWIMSVQGRVLQFGIFRAMGMSRLSVISMLIWEQLLVSGAAIAFGIFLGNLTSLLYVPLFQLVYSSADQPVPFRVISQAGDAQKIYIVLGALLLVCIAILIKQILNIRIDQAVKLGED